MKLSIWFVVAALWLIVPQVMIRKTGGLMVGVMAGNGISETLAFAMSAFLMNLILWGWLIPLSIGLFRLLSIKRSQVAEK